MNGPLPRLSAEGIFLFALATTVAGALLAALSSRIIRSVCGLAICCVGLAGLYYFLHSPFLALMEILIYVGAISVVIILAIMLTRQFASGSRANTLRLPALIVSAILFGLMAYAVLKTNWKLASGSPAAPDTQVLAGQLFGNNGFILPLEISAVLILAVVIGAIVIAREK